MLHSRFQVLNTGTHSFCFVYYLTFIFIRLFCITPAVAVRRSVTNPKLSSLMLFTGEPITAKEAYEHGLVSRIVPENDLERETNKIAQQICAHSRPVVAVGKKYLQMQDEKDDLLNDYRVATRGMIENLELKDTQHGLESFIKKTRPTWTHKTDKI
jgi:enoyl-CoA hydratase/carnithine racemase